MSEQLKQDYAARTARVEEFPKPNFFLVGAAKCGTTSLASYLRQHPEVYFSGYKEPNYFAFIDDPLPLEGPAPRKILFDLLYKHTLDEYSAYRRSYSGGEGYRVIADASVRYLYSPTALEHIHSFNPDAKIVAVLRDPVKRLFSHFTMMKQFQLEPLSLEEALAAEEDRIKAGWDYDWHYCQVGQYAPQLQRVFDNFDKDQVKVVLYDDYALDPLRVFAEICTHLSIDPHFKPDMSKREKEAYAPKNFALDRFLNWPNKTREMMERSLMRPLVRRVFKQLRTVNAGPLPSFDPAMRDPLLARFQDDAAALEDLLQRKIPWRIQG